MKGNAGVLFERFLRDKVVMKQDLLGLWGKADRAPGAQQGFTGTLILGVSDCQEELGDFGETSYR